MKPPSYFEAAIPEPFRILGQELKPFSLGRYKILNRMGCAFVSAKEAAATIEDLIIGILVCSMRCDEFLVWVRSKSFDKDIRKWSDRITGAGIIAGLGKWIKPLGRWWRKGHSFCALEKIQMFQKYIEDGQRVPRFWDKGDSGQCSGEHWAHNMEVILRQQGWSGEEINEEPLTRAFADYFSYAQSQGRVQLMTEDEIELVDSVKESEVVGGA